MLVELQEKMEMEIIVMTKTQYIVIVMFILVLHILILLYRTYYSKIVDYSYTLCIIRLLPSDMKSAFFLLLSFCFIAYLFQCILLIVKVLYCITYGLSEFVGLLVFIYLSLELLGDKYCKYTLS